MFPAAVRAAFTAHWHKFTLKYIAHILLCKMYQLRHNEYRSPVANATWRFLNGRLPNCPPLGLSAILLVGGDIMGQAGRMERERYVQRIVG